MALSAALSSACRIGTFSSSLYTGTITETAGESVVWVIGISQRQCPITSTEENLPNPYHLSVARHFDCPHRLSGLKCRLDVTRHTLLFSIPDKKRIASDEQIDAVLFGVNFTVRPLHASF